MEHAYESRTWADAHEHFSRWMGGALAALGRGLDRLAGRDGASRQLAALVAAFAITLITFRGTVV